MILDEIYIISIRFLLGDLVNDAINHHLAVMESICKMRGRKIDYVHDSLKTFINFVETDGKDIGLSLSKSKDRIVEEKILNMSFKCGINKNIKDKNHFILCVAMDDIREELHNFDTPMIYFTHFEKDGEEIECCHDFLDILTYHEYFENPLKYIKIEKIEKKS